jgi:GNAT superfamily N-acetyltransferase
MSAIEVRPFHRRDREQLAALVNAHSQAVVPGMGVSISTLLGQLEHRPSEAIVDPWVSERATLVAEQANRVMAAAHMLRHHAGDRAGSAYRESGGIEWLLFWPAAPAGNPYWREGTEAAERLIAACVRQLEQWEVADQYADGDLPVPGIYGVPDQWPHIRALYERAGFFHGGHTEVIYLAAVEDLPHPSGAPIAGLSVRRSVGINGTRLSAVLDEEEVGYIEVEIFEEGERLSRRGGWADEGNLHVIERHRRRGVATWLLGQAADWLRLAHVDRLLSYAWLEPSRDDTGQDYAEYRAFLAASGFAQLACTKRGWIRSPSS